MGERQKGSYNQNGNWVLFRSLAVPDLPQPVGPVTSTGRPSHRASATARRLRAVDSTATRGSDEEEADDEDDEEEEFKCRFEPLLGTRMPPMSIMNSFRSDSLMHTLLPLEEDDEDADEDDADDEETGSGASANEAASSATARPACNSCASIDSR